MNKDLIERIRNNFWVMSLLPSLLLRWPTRTMAAPVLFATLPRSVKMPRILVILPRFVPSGRNA